MVHGALELLTLLVVGCGVCIVDADGPFALTGQVQLAGGGGVAARVDPCGALELLAVAGRVDNAHTCAAVALLITAGDEGVNHTVCGLELVVEQACGHIALDLLNLDGVLVVGDGLLVFLELTLGHLRFSSSNRCSRRSRSRCRALRCGCCGRSLRGCRRGGRLSGSSRRARRLGRTGGGGRAATRNQHDNRQDENNQQSQRTTDNTPNLSAGEQTLLLGAVLALICGLGDVGVAQRHGCLVLIGHLTRVGLLSVVRLTLVGVVLVLTALDVLAALRVLVALEALTLEILTLVLATLEALALETISLVWLEAVRCLTHRNELSVLAALHVLAGLFRQVHGTLGQVDGALGFRSVELNERGALDSVGSLFGGGGNLSNGSLSNRFSDRFSCRRCLGGNLGDGLNNNGLCNRFGNNRLRSGGLGNSGLGNSGLCNRSLNNVRLNSLLSNRLNNGSLSGGLRNYGLFCGRLGCENLLGQSGAGQRNLSQVTHRLRLGGFLSGLLNGLNRGHLSLGCCNLRNLNDLLTFELSGELLQVNVLNGQRCCNLGGLLSNYGLSNLLSGSRLGSGLLGNQRLNSSLFNLNGFRLGLFDPQLPAFRNGTPRGVGAPRGSGGPSGRRSGPVGRRIEDECHKKAAFLVLKKHPGRAVISDYVYERIIATNYCIGSENEPREWWVFDLIHGFFNGFETFCINQYLKVSACLVTPEPAETRSKG